MPQGPDDSRTPLLDAWIEEEGEEAVVEAVDTIRRGVTDGSLPIFDDRAQFLDHLKRGRRQSA